MKNRIVTISFREIKSSFKRFLSLLVMSFLGVAVFVGMRDASMVLLASLDKYYDDNNVYDIKIVSTLGLTDNDIEELKKLDLVEEAYGIHSKDVYFNSGDKKLVVKMIEYKENINEFILEEGRLPVDDKEILVEKNLLKVNDLKRGDTINISYDDEDVSKDLKIIGIISSPLYITASTPSTTRGNTNIGAGAINYYTFVNNSIFNMDCYTEIYIKVKGAKELITGKEEYNDLIKKAKDEILSIKEVREKARFEEMKEEYSRKIDEEEQKGLAELNNAKKQLDYFKSELDNASYKITNGKKEIENGKIELQNGLNQIEEGKREVAINEEKLNNARIELENGERELNNKLSEYNLTIDDVKTIREILKGNEVSREKLKNLVRLESPYAEYINRVIDYFYDNGYYHLLKEYLETGFEEVKQELISVIPKDTPHYDEVVNYISNLTLSKVRAKVFERLMDTDNVIIIKSHIPTYIPGYSKIISFLDRYIDSVSRIKQLFNAIDEIDAGKLKLEEAQWQLNDAKMMIEDGQRAYEYNKARIEQAEKDIAAGEIEYNNNLALYNSKLREYNKAKAEFEEKIKDAREELNTSGVATWYVTERMDNSEYSGFMDIGGSIDNLAKAFPSIFFIVAIFMSLMSMSRMAIEDRGEIGTLKSLGFSKEHIMLKYLLYSASATIIGGIFGSMFGFYFLTWFIWRLYGILYEVKVFTYYYQIWPVFVGIIIAVICISGAALLTVRGIIKENTASLLRPKAPLKGKNIFFERFRIWNKINFSNKVTIRNVVRYKKRVVMTIIGIAGCTILLITGYGIRDSIVKIADKQFGEVFTYDDFALLDGKETNLDLLFSNEHIDKRVDVKFLPVTIDNTNINIHAISNNSNVDDIIHLKSTVNKKDITIQSGKVVISDKLSKMKKLKVGDSIKFKDNDDKEYSLEISDICENYVANYIYMDQDTYSSNIGDYIPNIVYFILDNIDYEKEVTTEVINNHHVMSITSVANTRVNVTNMLNALNYIILVLLVLSGMLSFVVLYNLSYINISERKREIATLKVLGFYNGEVDNYIIKENFIITIAGIIVGLLLSKLFVNFIVDSIEIDLVKFIHSIDITSYLYTFGFMILFTIIVSIIVHHSLRKIDMIESLKSIE